MKKSIKLPLEKMMTSKASRLKELKQRFEDTMNLVTEKVGMSTSEVTRDIYTRVTVDTDIEGRLNKEELVEIGGFTKNKEELVGKENILPKILVIDLETSNIIARVWGLWNQNIGLNQIIKPSTIISYSAKFIGDDKIYYNDTFYQKNQRDDKKLVQEIISLMDSADFILYFNGKKFDGPRINSRAAANKLKRPKELQEIDPLQIAKKYLGFESNKLEYLTHMLCTKYKKKNDRKYVGQSLWNEFENRNEECRIEMEEYNKLDVLSLEELYLDHLAPYDKFVPNFSSFNDSPIFKCNCGNDTFKPAGYHITKKSKFEKFQCTHCGKTHRSSKNLHSKEKRESLLV